MHRPWRIAVMAGALLCAAFSAQAGAIGTGLLGDRPHVTGTLRSGESSSVDKPLEALFASMPVDIAIAADSDPLELLRLSRWLKSLRPALRVEKSCVGACALFVLFSARELQIAPGSVIAFGGMSEVAGTLDKQIAAGDLFEPSSDTSQASRQRFLQAWAEQLASARELRQARSLHPQLPVAAQRLLDELMSSWRIEQLLFSSYFLETKLSEVPGRCLWWIPDAEGLRQLGLQASGYRPVERAVAAQLLRAPDYLIQVGPLPAGRLPHCEKPAGTTEPLLELRP